MKNNFLNQKIIFVFIILFSYNNALINDTELLYNISSIGYNLPMDFLNASEDQCIHINIQLDDEQKSQLKDSYLHFATWPHDLLDMDNQQLIFSSKVSCPDISEAEYYSLKSSDNNDLIIKMANEEEMSEVYLRVKCFNYPCNYHLYTSIEKDYVYLSSNINNRTLYSSYGCDSYSYFFNENTSIKFIIPSSLNKAYTNNAKHVVTISVTNPNDAETNFAKLYLVEEEKKNIAVDSIKSSTGIIFTFIEENIIRNYSVNNFYALEIKSNEKQFVSFSLKFSEYNGKKLESKIIPNYYSYYSYLNTENFSADEECFTIVGRNINNSDLLYASIYYDSLPIKPYLKYNNNYIVKKDPNIDS